ncbi:MAG TPA: class I SAM-dependent methyltransferase, partial [Alphaproteobacteria bacterium]|nr:class I SAM-dependent methyltransferase [Alphaproteobacteria bacterium]
MNITLNKIKKWLMHPKLILSFVQNKFVKYFGKRYSWRNLDKNVNRKDYATYEDYLQHQKSKLSRVEQHLNLVYDEKFRKILRDRLISSSVVSPGLKVLCLAARLGTEVKSFIDLGCFAVGIDLNPGKNNKYVLHGDFHNIQFPENSVDIVYTNSIDHTFDLNRLIVEIKRVLNKQGIFILEINKGLQEGSSPGYYEALAWKRTDDVVDLFIASDFIV